MQLGGDSQRMEADGPPSLLVADIGRLAGTGAPILGKAHVLVGDGLATAPGRYNMRKQDTDGSIGAVSLDGFSGGQRFKLPPLGLVGDHRAKDAQTELGAGRQTVRKLAGGWVSQ